jgi:hypothetical protein
MRKRFAALLLLGWLIPAGIAWAESPVVVSHTMTGYSMGTDSVILSYVLNVKNTGTDSVTNVALSYVPLMIVSTKQITLNVAVLESQAELQVPFTITTPMLFEQDKFSSQPLFWAGTCKDGSGNQIDFPAQSVEGGAL